MNVLGLIAAELIVANTHDGLVGARGRGRKAARRPKRTVQQLAALFGVPQTTVYGHLDATGKGRRPMNQPAATNAFIDVADRT